MDDKILLGDSVLERTKGEIPFHMPGHKRARRYAHLMGVESYDVTEIEGLDDLHNARGIILDSERRAAELFGARFSRFLVGGSTAGILAAIRATTRPGDRVVIARNCHRSVYNAVELLGLEADYALPSRIGDFYGGVSAAEIERLLAREGAKLVVVTSPTYEGIISDIAAISEACHRRGALLLVDEAHGAHLGLYGAFKDSARQLGADIVVNSLHKTLPALTQTALLHVLSKDVDMGRVDEALAAFESSSPSYVLMSSIDGLVDYLRRSGEEALCAWQREVTELRRRLSRLLEDGESGIALFDGAEGCFGIDESRLCFTCPDGYALAAELRKRHIELEMAGANHAIALTGMGDTRQSFDLLFEAMKEVKTHYRYAKLQYELPSRLPEKVMSSARAAAAEAELVQLFDCAGRVACENVWVYPPGAPVIVKGERIDGDTLMALSGLQARGAQVQSSRGAFPQGLLCARR